MNIQLKIETGGHFSHENYSCSLATDWKNSLSQPCSGVFLNEDVFCGRCIRAAQDLFHSIVRRGAGPFFAPDVKIGPGGWMGRSKRFFITVGGVIVIPVSVYLLGDGGSVYAEEKINILS